MRMILPDLTEALLAENRAWLAPAALDAGDNAILCFQSYVIRTPHHVILVDSCAGNDKHRPQAPMWHMQTSTTYVDALHAASVRFEDVDYVLCTHLHADHVGWNTRLRDGRWVPTFPRARDVFSKTEYAYYAAQHEKSASGSFADSVLPIMEANRAELVADTHQIGDHVRLIPTPGHTPGHVAVGLGRGADHAVFAGDVLHSPIQMRYPDISFVGDTDRALAAQSRRALLARYAETPALCCFAHLPSPSVGRLRAWGEGFRCEEVA